MKTRKSLITHTVHLAIMNILVIGTSSIWGKPNPGFMSPSQVSAMQQERENSPIDRIELARAQEKFKPKPIKTTKKGTVKKQRIPKKTLRYMTYEETKEGKNKLLASGNHFVALKYQERMLKLCDDLNELEALFLEYADTHRHCNHYDKAASLYNEFVTSYPGSTHTEYALYQAVECSSKLILDADRDQTNTHKTIALANQFLEKADLFAQYKEKVEKIRTHCYTLLVRSEYNIYHFYEYAGDYNQAQRRLQGLRTDWLEVVPQLEPELLTLECQLAKKQHKLELAHEKELELANKFPHAVPTVVAAHKPVTNFVAKF
jgi:outer membrane protein assembly factor BamD (BamD/ComL family)